MSEKYNMEEVKPQVMRFGETGDYILGTLTEINKMTKPDTYGKLSTVYTVKAKDGKFLGSSKNEKTGKWVDDKEPTIIKEGEVYSVFLTGVAVQNMKKIRLGQIFKIAFTELKPTDKGNDAKIKVVYGAKDKQGLPLIDEEWLAEQKASGIQSEEEAAAFEGK